MPCVMKSRSLRSCRARAKRSLFLVKESPFEARFTHRVVAYTNLEVLLGVGITESNRLKKRGHMIISIGEVDCHPLGAIG